MKPSSLIKPVVLAHISALAALVAIQGCTGIAQQRAGIHSGELVHSSASSSHSSSYTRTPRFTRSTRGTSEHKGIFRRIKSVFTPKSSYRTVRSSGSTYSSGSTGSTYSPGSSYSSSSSTYTPSSSYSSSRRSEMQFPPRSGSASAYQPDRVAAAASPSFRTVSTTASSSYNGMGASGNPVIIPTSQTPDFGAAYDRASPYASPARGFQTPDFLESQVVVGGALISDNVVTASAPTPDQLVASGQFPPSSPNGMFGASTKVTVPSFSPGYIAPLDSPAPAAPSMQKITVQKGDNLTKIARRYGVSVKQVKSWNGLKGDLIKVGQKLSVSGSASKASSSTYRAPPRAKAPAKTVAKKSSSSSRTSKPVRQKGVIGPDHKVVSGDSLSTIAYKYGIKTSALKKANGLVSDRIMAGWSLAIPSGTTMPSTRIIAEESKDGGPPIVQTFPSPRPVVPKINKDGFDAEFTTSVQKNDPIQNINVGTTEDIGEKSSVFSEESELFEYIVVEGDSINSIAGAFITTVDDIKKHNSTISEPLTPGALIKIPPLR